MEARAPCEAVAAVTLIGMRSLRMPDQKQRSGKKADSSSMYPICSPGSAAGAPPEPVKMACCIRPSR